MIATGTARIAITKQYGHMMSCFTTILLSDRILERHLLCSDSFSTGLTLILPILHKGALEMQVFWVLVLTFLQFCCFQSLTSFNIYFTPVFICIINTLGFTRLEGIHKSFNYEMCGPLVRSSMTLLGFWYSRCTSWCIFLSLE